MDGKKKKNRIIQIRHYRLRAKIGGKQYYNSKKNIEENCKKPAVPWRPVVTYGWDGYNDDKDWNGKLCKAPSFYAGFAPVINKEEAIYGDSAYGFRC